MGWIDRVEIASDNPAYRNQSSRYGWRSL